MHVCGAQPAAQTVTETLTTEDHELLKAATGTGPSKILEQHLETLRK